MSKPSGAFIKGGVLYNPSRKKGNVLSSESGGSGVNRFRAGRGEFMAGGSIHLSAANARQMEARSFVPFQASV